MGVLFNDVVINKLSGGLGRRASNQDMISGLLFNGVDISKEVDSKQVKLLEDDKIYRLASIDDAKTLGITQEYDTKGESAFYQISQFFRINPSGDLLIYKNKEAKTYAALVAVADNMQIEANGEIRQLAIIFKGEEEAKPKATPEYFEQTTNAVIAAGVVTQKAFANHRPIEIFLEGKGFDATKTSVDLRTLNASGVSVIVAMDLELTRELRFIDTDGKLYQLQKGDVVLKGKVTNPDLEGGKKEKAKVDAIGYNNTAAVGVLLGAVSRAKVSENIAWIEKFNLVGEGFRSVGFVGGKKLKTEGEQKTLDTNKYIFSRSHIGIAGVYFNDSHTCINTTSDFAFIESNRTIHKATRLARRALLPKVNAPVLVDPENGTLSPSVVKGYETLCRAALEFMVSNGEVSEMDVFVDPLQNILAESILRVKIEIIPTGTARRIEVDLGFKNPFGINV